MQAHPVGTWNLLAIHLSHRYYRNGCTQKRTIQPQLVGSHLSNRDSGNFLAIALREFGDGRISSCFDGTLRRGNWCLGSGVHEDCDRSLERRDFVSSPLQVLCADNFLRRANDKFERIQH